MRTTWIYAAAMAAALGGCVTYPVYQAPVARLTPAQSAALAAQPIDPAERDRYAKASAEVQREDQANLDAQRQAAVVVPYTYAYPAPYSYGYYGYPWGGYYGGFAPWYPGISLSFGYRGGFGGYRGRGGYYGGGHYGGGGRHR